MPYLPIGKLKKQCDKYLQAFGPGAVVFLNGFSQDLLKKMDKEAEGGMGEGGLLLLDAHPLDTSHILGIDKHTAMVHKEELVRLAHQNYLFFTTSLTSSLPLTLIFYILELYTCNTHYVLYFGIGIGLYEHLSSYLTEAYQNFYSMACNAIQDCPRQMMGVVIGKQGRTIKELMASSGCHITLHEDCLKVVITASSAEQLLQGRDQVQRVLEAGTRPLVQTVQVLCPVRKAGLVIGKQGTVVKQLMQQSGCVIKTNRQDVTPDGLSQIFHISANTLERIETATKLIQQLVDGRGRR